MIFFYVAREYLASDAFHCRICDVVVDSFDVAVHDLLHIALGSL
jgi:hypothetical protein